jgi:calcium permeable stress-gated cation channel
MSAIDPNKASKGNSTNAFVTALVLNAGLLVVEVGAFIILKSRLHKVYTPRTYLPPPE